MKTNPPAAADAPIVEKMKAIGLEPGKDFDPSKLGAFDREVIKTVPKVAQVKIMEYFKKAAEPVNGWMSAWSNGTTSLIPMNALPARNATRNFCRGSATRTNMNNALFAAMAASSLRAGGSRCCGTPWVSRSRWWP
jgi:hypothetical protein